MAETKKRARKPVSLGTIKITISRTTREWRTEKSWLKMNDDVHVDHQYQYVTEELPVNLTSVLLEQSLPESKLDLAKVIKAINGL